ncbi:queuosine precursor transporter [Nonlabens ponticola]|uniref:Probable queuosine precursor transporter n=1 Tax=Nonlabens ponticola TaxID=2496866 RepID=A0A3S9MW29_9FLAO|nr:queuosine precursor transporter [Nonlabens ponticola]AZQ43323.1 VUT family protein [Nonlabens ponticola]
MKQLQGSKLRLAHRIYLVLAALFICSLVVSNLIFQKFFYWNPFGLFRFEISVGLLPYPITFLITDLVSEIYGRRKANDLVLAGIFASVFSLGIIYVADKAPAIESSAIQDALFTKVFGATTLAVISSMMAYLFAQFVDIQIYHFWKRVTKGKMLWLRNNLSTFFSQFVDTMSVLLLLCYAELLPWEKFWPLLGAGFLFKVLVALLDTPLLYAGVYAFQRLFKLERGEELLID